MTTYDSLVNTYYGDMTIDPNTSFTGVYDDASGYTVVKVWCSASQGANLIIHQADSTDGTGDTPELYAIYEHHASAITSLVKKRYVMTQLINYDTVNPLTEVNLKTKFAQRQPHPYLSYMSDDITANVVVSIDDVRFSTVIDHSTNNILVYGSHTEITDGNHHAIRTDNKGSVTVVGKEQAGTEITGINPILIGGYDSDTALLTCISTDAVGYINSNVNNTVDTRALLYTTDSITVSGNNIGIRALDSGTDSITVSQSTNSNLKCCSTMQIGGVNLEYGQSTMSSSIPVVIASNQSAIQVGQSNRSSLKTSSTLQVQGNDITYGQKTMEYSLPVTFSSDQSNLSVIQPVRGNLLCNASLQAQGTDIPLGQTTMANSLPVTIASNQGVLSSTFMASSSTGGTSIHRTLNVGSTGINIKTSAGRLYSLNVSNADVTGFWLKLYSTVSPTKDTIPIGSYWIGANRIENIVFPIGLYLTAISYRCSGLMADDDETSLTADTSSVVATYL